jgi:hypothetical protein
VSGGDEFVTMADHRALLARVVAAEAFIASLKAAIGGGSSTAEATDRELDAQYGDPQIKYAAKDWAGELVVGRRLSQTSIEYLEYLIDSNEDYSRYLRDKGDAKSLKTLGFKTKETKLARGWLRRMRDGWTPPAGTARQEPANPWRKPAPQAAPPPSAADDFESDDEIPF